MLTLKRLLLTVSIFVLAATVNAAPMDDAVAAYDRGDYTQAIKLFRPLVIQRNVLAQYYFGSMYRQGKGVTQDYEEAMKWYRLAATQGNATAQNALGYMYYEGKGVAQDYKEALRWFRFAAAEKDAVAQSALGYMYYENKGVTQDYEEAMKWYRLAATQGNATAQNALGYMYYEGKGVTQNFREALMWIHRAAVQGNVSAQYNLGSMYYEGKGVTQDYKEAMKWYRLAATQEHAPAQYGLGYMYSEGEGVIQSQKEAMKWHHLAADKGFEPAKNAIRSATLTPIDFNPFDANENWRGSDPIVGELDRKISLPKLVFNSSILHADGFVELSGKVISSANISEISINGHLLEVPLARDGSFRVTRNLPIGVVTNYRLSVTDEFGQKADAEVNVERKEIQYTEEAIPLDPYKVKAKENPNAIALIIGIEAYLRLPQAQYADSDANYFYDYANHALGIPVNKIKLLTNAKANRTDLLLAMKSWLKTGVVSGKSDVYIFFAGHGLASADGDKTYLLPADGDRDLLDETSILRDDLIASAKGAKTITLFLDTCYSGGTRTNETLLADARPIAIVPNMSALPSNVTVLAAASSSQLSSTYEAAQQGLFSYWLMKGLEGDADANKDKKITAGELHEYVAKQVGPMAQRRNRQQDPQLIGDGTRVLVNY